MDPILTKHVREPNSFTLEFSLKHQAYDGLRKALTMQPGEVIDLVKASGLRGRGGAGFPTGLKWQFVLKDSPLPKYICCNADESEPGTFKDHVLMERNPHLAVRGLPHWLLGHRREGRLHLHSRRVLSRPAHARGRAGQGVRARLLRQEHPRDRLRLRHRDSPRRRRLRGGRGNRAHRIARGQTRPAAHQTAVSGVRRASTTARQRSTTSRRSATCRPFSSTARNGLRRSAQRRMAGRSSSASAVTSRSRASTKPG